jgi:hypothetical protein
MFQPTASTLLHHKDSKEFKKFNTSKILENPVLTTITDFIDNSPVGKGMYTISQVLTSQIVSEVKEYFPLNYGSATSAMMRLMKATHSQKEVLLTKAQHIMIQATSTSPILIINPREEKNYVALMQPVEESFRKKLVNLNECGKNNPRKLLINGFNYPSLKFVHPFYTKLIKQFGYTLKSPDYLAMHMFVQRLRAVYLYFKATGQIETFGQIMAKCQLDHWIPAAIGKSKKAAELCQIDFNHPSLSCFVESEKLTRVFENLYPLQSNINMLKGWLFKLEEGKSLGETIQAFAGYRSG